MDKTEVYLGLGTNTGDRRKNIYDALQRLDGGFGTGYTALSGIYETEPWGFDSPSRFLNCTVRYDTAMRPEDILRLCKSIEKGMGRDISGPRYDASGNRIYTSRIIDIDILLYGNRRISLPGLVIPHPLMAERDFVMVPLSETVSAQMKSCFPEIFLR